MSLPARLRGLLLRAPRDGVTVLAPCRDVHTLGMTRAIDVAFADDRGRVIRAFRDVGPARRLRCPGAAVALERFAADGPWLRPGDQMEIAVASAAAREEDGGGGGGGGRGGGGGERGGGGGGVGGG